MIGFFGGFVAGTIGLWLVFLGGRYLKHRNDVYNDLRRRVAELARYRADVERLAVGQELEQLGAWPTQAAPGILAARQDAKKVAQAFIARYSGSSKP